MEDGGAASKLKDLGVDAEALAESRQRQPQYDFLMVCKTTTK